MNQRGRADHVSVQDNGELTLAVDLPSHVPISTRFLFGLARIWSVYEDATPFAKPLAGLRIAQFPNDGFGASRVVREVNSRSAFWNHTDAAAHNQLSIASRIERQRSGLDRTPRFRLWSSDMPRRAMPEIGQEVVEVQEVWPRVRIDGS
jgi:hypothetical protein